MKKSTLNRKTLYLDNVGFNNALVINALAKVIISRGGYVQKPKYNTYTFYRRHVLEEIEKTRETIERVKNNNPANISYISKREKELKKLLRFSKSYKCNYSNYLTFIFEGNVYYFQMEDNPFFENHYSKIPFSGFDNVVDKNYYLDSFNIWECFEKANFDIFSFYMARKNAEKLAIIIFETLVNCRASKHYNDRIKRHETYKRADFLGEV